jgi:hypothetical protein
MNADKNTESNSKLPPETDELLARIRQRRKEIQQCEGLLTDSVALIHEDRDR